MTRILLVILALLPAALGAAGYFQQKVVYDMEARLDGQTHVIHVNQGLLYINQSPDTLSEIYFHLYMNRYRKGAFLEDGGLRENTIGGIDLDTVWVNRERVTGFTIDHTLMRLPLRTRLLPGDTLAMRFRFRAALPPSDARYGYMGDHHDVGNWFVTPVVYDSKGWHLHQHIDNEFYQEWGDFDVRLTVPRGYVVGATGDLINADSAMRDTTAAARDWFNHHPDDTTRFTTWHYIAENVHDFAWTADPDYRYYTEEVRGITVHYLVMDHNYDDWVREIRAGTGAMEWLIDNIGPYPYKQITVADTYMHAGGMEYPNIVFINTFISPRYAPSFFRAVVIHEIAHNWFYGLLASNQTEDEWMDEGFTQFAEIEIMEYLYGVKNNYPTGGMHGGLGRLFSADQDDRQASMLNYLRSVIRGTEADPVRTMPDHFRRGVYVASYDKTAVVLAMLENVLGREVFWRAMRDYYRRWHHKHPQTGDMIRSFERSSGRSLKWFFDQWINSTRSYDVALSGFSSRRVAKGFVNEITLENKQDVYMPLDVLCVLENGDSLLFRVPIDSFSPRRADVKYLPYWFFKQKEYHATFLTPEKVVFVQLDPGRRLGDINRLNNDSGRLPRQDFYFMRQQSMQPPVDAYLWEMWPTMDYNLSDKLRPGIHLNGSYLGLRHKLNATLYYRPGRPGVDGILSYGDPLISVAPRLNTRLQIWQLNGLRAVAAELRYTRRDRDSFIFGGEAYGRYERIAGTPAPAKTVATLHGAWLGGISAGGGRFNSVWELRGRASLYGSAYGFAQLLLNQTHTIRDSYSDYVLTLKNRMALTRGTLPGWERFLSYGANARVRFDNPYYRSLDNLSRNWDEPARIYMADGAAVRGSQFISGAFNISGRNALQLSADLEFPNPLSGLPIPVVERLSTRLFADGGLLWDGRPRADRAVYAAGFSLGYRLPYMLTRLSGLDDIRVEFPLWVYAREMGEKSLAFRWLLNLSFDLGRSPFFNRL